MNKKLQLSLHTRLLRYIPAVMPLQTTLTPKPLHVAALGSGSATKQGQDLAAGRLDEGNAHAVRCEVCAPLHTASAPRHASAGAGALWVLESFVANTHWVRKVLAQSCNWPLASCSMLSNEACTTGDA